MHVTHVLADGRVFESGELKPEHFGDSLPEVAKLLGQLIALAGRIGNDGQEHSDGAAHRGTEEAPEEGDGPLA